jgi:hypothetical protein
MRQKNVDESNQGRALASLIWLSWCESKNKCRQKVFSLLHGDERWELVRGKWMSGGVWSAPEKPPFQSINFHQIFTRKSWNDLINSFRIEAKLFITSMKKLIFSVSFLVKWGFPLFMTHPVPALKDQNSLKWWKTNRRGEEEVGVGFNL